MSRFQELRERGLLFPLGIAIGLGLMVLWNGVFITLALQNAPDVSPAYTHALER